jgi:hypothetical protein
VHGGWEVRGPCCSVCELLSCYFPFTGVRLSRTQDHSAWRLGGQATLLLSGCYVISCYLSFSWREAQSTISPHCVTAGRPEDHAAHCVT